MIKLLRLWRIITISLVFNSAHSIDTIYNAADDFSLSNPNGVWSYGYSTSLGGTFIAFPLTNSNYHANGIEAHYFPLSADQPSAIRNSNAVVTTPFCCQPLNPGQLALHPGPAGQFSIVRWTAPESGNFNLSGNYIGMDTSGTTTDVHVLFNGVTIFDDFINGFSDTALISLDTLLQAGDLLDFAVGFGSNSNFFSDYTGLDVQISRNIPEPRSTMIFVLAVVILVVHCIRQRRGGNRVIFCATPRDFADE